MKIDLISINQTDIARIFQRDGSIRRLKPYETV